MGILQLENAEWATWVTRLTKMPGVTTASGDSSPNATLARTCTMVVFAAMHMMGPKLRALLR